MAKKTWIAIDSNGLIIGHGYEPHYDEEDLVVVIRDRREIEDILR